MTNKLPDIQEEPDILKLKEKLQSISNPYYIAPYDSLQLYHYEVKTQFWESILKLAVQREERLNSEFIPWNGKIFVFQKNFIAIWFGI